MSDVIDWILVAVALAMNTGGTAPAATATQGGGSADRTPGFVAEPQSATGQFTTALEVKPILQATKTSWVAVREYEGRDLVYLTHLLSWRCGLHEIRYGVNDGPMQVWPMPPCHDGTAQPNALRPEDGLPYVEFPPGTVQSLSVELLFDDLDTANARFERVQVLMP